MWYNEPIVSQYGGRYKMYILAISINHRTADVGLREQVAFKPATMPDALETLYSTKSILENVILSTCNRTEIYVVTDQVHTGRYYTQRFLAQSFGLDIEKVKGMTEVFVGDAAVEHLLRVTVGLDSMVLGETQILGQIRDAFLLAQTQGTTGTVFNHLFKQAITFSKKAHRETDIAEHPVSISYAAVELAKKVYGQLDGKSAMVIGAGEMSALSVLNLKAAGATHITVVNRTFEHAQTLAEKHDVNCAPWSELKALLANVDLVVSATRATDYIIRKDMVAQRVSCKYHDPLILIDIAVPRDIEPGLEQLGNVFSYDVDNLKHLVDTHLKARERAAETIEAMIPLEIDSHNAWLNMLGVVPVIKALREQALEIQADTMDSLDRKLPGLSEHERKVISKHMKSIVNQMLKEPIKQAKEFSNDRKSKEKIELFKTVFDINLEDYETKEYESKEPLLKQHTVSFDS